jgi:FkbM family methyltransferase
MKLRKWLISEITQYVVLNYLYRNKRRYDFIVHNDWIGYNIVLNGLYEEDQLNEIIKCLNFDTKTTEVLDIGANIGNHTVFFSEFFLHVHSFEPQLRTFEILKLNTSRFSNVSLNNFGISTTDSQVVFKVPYMNSGAASQNLNDHLCYEELVFLKRIDTNDNYKDVSLIKIDVEGNEIDVIQSCSDLIIRTQPVILFELNASGNHEVIKVLNSFGYSNYYSQGKLEVFSKVNGSLFHHKIIRMILRLALFKSRLKIYRINEFRRIDYPIIIATHPSSKYQIKC